MIRPGASSFLPNSTLIGTPAVTNNNTGRGMVTTREQRFDYTFDTIGNRTATGGRASAVSAYTPNRLNQYSQRTVPSQVDVLGVANPSANVTVRVVGGTTFTAASKGEYYHHALNVGNNVYPQGEVKSRYGASQAQTNRVFNPPATETLTHDADGNLTQDGRWTYTWDGENRLVEMKRDTDTPAGARQRLVFEYDYQGRRIRKQYYTYSGGWQEQTDVIFLYDLAGQAGGWNLMGEPSRATGTLAKKNPFRFSTKYTDNETGPIYYGYRYYDPVTGQWPNRDPIGEQGGCNLYVFSVNTPCNHLDLHGLIEVSFRRNWYHPLWGWRTGGQWSQPYGYGSGSYAAGENFMASAIHLWSGPAPSGICNSIAGTLDVHPTPGEDQPPI